MKRRNFLVRSFIGATSATVFTATGWLMGTRTLTMPPPWTTYEQITCPNGQFDCGCLQPGYPQSFCFHGPECADPGCKKQVWEQYNCCSGAQPYCEARYQQWPCGSCQQCNS